MYENFEIFPAIGDKKRIYDKKLAECREEFHRIVTSRYIGKQLCVNYRGNCFTRSLAKERLACVFQTKTRLGITRLPGHLFLFST